MKCNCFRREAEIKPKEPKASRGHTFSGSLNRRTLLRVRSWVNNSSTIASATNNALASKGQIKKVMKTKDPKIFKNQGRISNELKLI